MKGVEFICIVHHVVVEALYACLSFIFGVEMNKLKAKSDKKIYIPVKNLVPLMIIYDIKLFDS